MSGRVLELCRLERAIVSALVPVILTKPSHKTLHPYFDWRGQPIAYVPHQRELRAALRVALDVD